MHGHNRYFNAYNLCIKNYFAASGVPMEYEG